MTPKETPSRTEQALSGALILLVLSATYGAGYALSALIGLLGGGPAHFELPGGARLLGLVLLIPAGWVAASVFRVRRLQEVWISTSVTFLKLVRRLPFTERAGRTEPFVPNGPYAYVRSPMYFGIVLGIAGLGMALSALPLLLWAVVLGAWYWVYLIPFEEKELEALFGESYSSYRQQVPKLFPYGKRFRPGR